MLVLCVDAPKSMPIPLLSSRVFASVRAIDSLQSVLLVSAYRETPAIVNTYPKNHSGWEDDAKTQHHQ